MEKINFDPRVKFTRNYSQFKKLGGNRDVGSCKKLIKSIEKVGYIPNPIIVNEKMEVADGQHRLQACEELGIPIAYIVIPGVTVETARNMNTGQKNWKNIDYIKSYAETGNASYQKILLIQQKYPILLVNVITVALRNSISNSGSSTYDRHIIETGKFSVNDAEFKETVATIDKSKDLFEPAKKIKGRQEMIQTAIIWIARNTSISMARLRKNIEEKYLEFYPATDVSFFLRGISEVYNKGCSRRIYLDTEYEKFKVKRRKERKNEDE